MRKLVAVLLGLGFLAAVQCRVACALPMSDSAGVEKHESGCHHESGEPKKNDSEKPCCMTHVGGDDALLPSSMPTFAPRAVLAVISIGAQTGPVITPLRLLGSKRSLDPPRVVSEVLPLSSLSPRAPPAAVL